MQPAQDFRQLCLSLPATEERLSHGEPAWFVRGKVFVTFANHHHDDRVAFWCAANRDQRDAMVGAAPDRFFVPPYYGVRGWLGVYLDVPVEWTEIADIVAEAHALISAPRKRATSPGATPR